MRIIVFRHSMQTIAVPGRGRKWQSFLRFGRIHLLLKAVKLPRGIANIIS